MAQSRRFSELLRCSLAVAVLAGMLFSPALAQDRWVGRKFMPREGFRAQIGKREISPLSLTYPLVVSKVDGDWLWIGKAWVKQQHVVPLEEAADYYTAHLRKFPESGSIYNMRGVVYTELGQWDEAITDFTQALRLNPKQPATIYSNRGMVWFHLKNDDFAIADFNQALRIDPQNAVAYANRGWTRWTQEKYAEAVEDYTRVLALDPKYPDAWFHRGSCLLAQEENDNAIDDFTRAIEQSPRHAGAYYKRGVARLNTGESDRAIDDFDEAIRFDADHVDAYNDRGVAWYRKGDYDRAIADFTEAIRLDEDKTLAYHNRAEASYLKRDYGPAIADYRHVARLTPDEPNAWNEIAWLLATCPEARHRDGQRAVEAATRACELTKWQDGNSIDTLAAAYAEAGDFEKAREYARRAVELAGDDVKQEYAERAELYAANKPFRHEPPAAVAASDNNKKQPAISIAQGTVTINGVKLKLPSKTADLVKALGKPERRANSLDPQRPPNRLVWDEAGIFAGLPVVVGQGRYDLETVDSLFISFLERDNPGADPRRAFSGKLTIDGTPVTPRSTIEEINRNHPERPFEENPNNGSFSITQNGLRMSLSPTPELTHAVSNISFKGLFLEPRGERAR